jgi:hypothetical protein
MASWLWASAWEASAANGRVAGGTATPLRIFFGWATLVLRVVLSTTVAAYLRVGLAGLLDLAVVREFASAVEIYEFVGTVGGGFCSDGPVAG